MAYASIAGRARTSASNPQAHAICDRCGCRYNFVDLSWQNDWRGPVIQNLRILVCRPCMDRPQEQQRAIVVPADPTPIINARPQDFAGASTDYRATSRPTVFDAVTGIPIPSTDLRVTQDLHNRTVVPYGNPTGLDANAIMPLQGTVTYGEALPVLSVFAAGCTVTITCSAVHHLQPGDQVAVRGLTAANGLFSVTVNSATSFSYQTVGPQTPQLTSNVLVQTALVGLPLGYDTLPMTVDDSPTLGVPTVPGSPTNVVAVFN